MADTPMNQAINPAEPSNANTSRMLRLFVYGTLKRGFWNHDRFCWGVLTVEAVVQGRLFETPSGIPVLQVPEAHILAHGTTDPLVDTATQAHVTARMSSPEPNTPDRLPRKGTGATWAPVYGELLTFDDPETRLPAIDRLEGFHPGGPCLYRCVLIPVRTNGAELPAWLYAVGDRWIDDFKELTGGIWQ